MKGGCFMAELEIIQDIASLQKSSSETIMDVIVSEELLANASYPRSYTGTVVDSASMPSLGQFRVQYIPYFSYNEGYSVQIAWGAVDNTGLWYRKSHGGNWEAWIEYATKSDLTSNLASKLDKIVIMANETSIDDVVETGIYKCEKWVTAPVGNSDNQGTIVCINYGGGASQSWTHQTFYSAHYDRVWTRNRNSKTWTDWKLSSNNGKSTFSCTASSGYTIANQNCYIQNGRAYLDVAVTKTDKTAITADSQQLIFTIPHVVSTPQNISITGWTNDGVILSGALCTGTAYTDKGVYVIVYNSSVTTMLRVKFEYDV